MPSLNTPDFCLDFGVHFRHINEDGNTYPVATIDCDQYYQGQDSLKLARFYASANPVAVLNLILRIEELEAKTPNVKINRRCRGGIGMEREEAQKATSELNVGLGERFEPLLDYLYAKEMGGCGWGANYDDKFAGNMDGNTKWATLKGHYSMLLDLALDLIPPAYIKELQTNRVYRA